MFSVGSLCCDDISDSAINIVGSTAHAYYMKLPTIFWTRFFPAASSRGLSSSGKGVWLSFPYLMGFGEYGQCCGLKGAM